MSEEPSRGGDAPIRAIYQAYLEVEKAHELFRRARDRGEESEVHKESAKADLQHKVLRFYNLLRPHLKSTDLLRPYWVGYVPEHPNDYHESIGEARKFYKENAIGLFQEPQLHTKMFELDQQPLSDGGVNQAQPPWQWHQFLNRPENHRVVSAYVEDKHHVFIQELQFSIMGLRELNTWKARKKKVRKKGEGFMAGETTTVERREFESPEKILKAKRMLADAAKKLNALPDFEVKDDRDASFDYDDLLESDEGGKNDGGE